MKNILSIVLFLFVFISCKQEAIKEVLETPNLISHTDASKAITKVLMEQQGFWNEGDIPSFMEGYWHSDDLIFVGRSGVAKGWQTTLDNYKKGYPNKDAMGQLSFEVLELDSLSNDIYRMVGTFELKRKDDKPAGIFTLIWRYIDGKWLIVSDHTTG